MVPIVGRRGGDVEVCEETAGLTVEVIQVGSRGVVDVAGVLKVGGVVDHVFSEFENSVSFSE